MPSAVKRELIDVKTPAAVRRWIADPPLWLNVREPVGPNAVEDLDAGETAAITLAVEAGADLVLMDDRRGVRAARSKGIAVTGTLAVLSRAGQEGIINLAAAFERLKRTNFRYPQAVMDQYLGRLR